MLYGFDYMMNLMSAELMVLLRPLTLSQRVVFNVTLTNASRVLNTPPSYNTY